MFITVAAQGQNTVTIQHKSYTTTFDKVKHYPVKVEWWITKAMINCPTKIKRTDNM